jgi:hypothetical protein
MDGDIIFSNLDFLILWVPKIKSESGAPGAPRDENDHLHGILTFMTSLLYDFEISEIFF